ncbi:MAG: glycosyl hydrolase family 18 protein [Mobilitalea sp.]
MKYTKKVLSILFIFFIILFFQITERTFAEAATIKMSSNAATLSIGSNKTLTVQGTKNKVNWSSSNKSVAIVSSTGKVTAKAPGITKITASVSGKKLYSQITVVKISSSSIILKVNDTKTLNVIGAKGKIIWSSSNKSIAIISAIGKVTAKAPGKVTIFATVDGVKLSSKITVTKTPIPTTAPSTPSVPSTPIEQTTTTVPATSTVPATPSVPPTPIEPEIPTAPTTPTVPQELPTDNSSDSSTEIVGYYAAWSKYSGFTPDKIDAKKLTTINYAFANISSDLKVTLGYPDIDAANIKQLNKLKLINPKLKTIISIGGWSWSARFSDAALTEESRNIFADSSIDFIVKYGFDGIDIDWEYPVSGGLSTNIKRPEDKRNFTLLLKTLREKLDKQEVLDGKEYKLTFAGAAGSWYVKNIELMEINKYVDYAYIMTYDIHGSWEPYTNFNAPLYSNDPLQPYRISVDTAINDWLKTGFPKEKLIMGVPFYGFIYKSVTNINQGLYQTYSGGSSISYANVATNYLKAPEYIRYYHEDSKVPYLFNGSTFITYEDEQSMAEKAKYVKQKNLGGVMIWELSQDSNKILLNSLYQELSQ